MGEGLNRRERTRHLATARREVGTADVHLTVALVAQTAASHANWNLTDDDTRTCVEEAYARYSEAAWRYLTAAQLAHGRCSRPESYQLGGLPKPLRSALRTNVAVLRRRASSAPTSATPSVDLPRIQSAVTAIRAVLATSIPALVNGLEHPLRCLERLRQGEVQP
jgi:hypothetical protein